MQTHLETAFADGRYKFWLTLPLIDELQKKTGVGLGGLFARLLRGRYVLEGGESFGMPTEAEWKIADLLETIRLALIGGAGGVANEQPVTVDMARANELVAAYCYPARPLKEAWDLATAILTAAIEGLGDTDEHPVKKKSERKRTQKARSTTSAPSAT